MTGESTKQAQAKGTYHMGENTGTEEATAIMHADLRLEAASVAFNRYIKYFISACMTMCQTGCSLKLNVPNLNLTNMSQRKRYELFL